MSQGTYSVVEPDSMRGEHKTLPDMLKTLPGIHISEIGGSGKYTTASIRGSTSAQVGVFLDSVLVNMGGDSAVDLSAIPIGNVERIEVYRGYIPARFGGTYMGGVINIVTKRPRELTGSVSVGARDFGGRQASLNLNAPLGRGSLLFSANEDRTDGDFPYKNFMAQREAPSAIAGRERFIQNVYDDWLPYKDFFFPDDESFEQFIAEQTEHYHGEIEYLKETMKERRRQNNAHKNQDVMLKWQDDNWQVKFGWKKIWRELADSVQPNTGGNWSWLDMDIPQYNSGVLLTPGWYAPREHTLTDHDLLIGYRDTYGNLELGYRLHLLDQKKEFRDHRFEKSQNRPALWTWSQYHSKRLAGAIDGSWRIHDHHLLEFLANWSKEWLDIDGNNIESRTDLRDSYTQTLWNLQLQDTITLNQSGDLWLTPSLKYHGSSGMGDSSDFKEEESASWIKKMEDTGGEKLTWNIALKKQFNQNWAMHSSVGSYYRFPNLYELIGDGAWILPSPTSGPPSPEHGKQWDLGVNYNGSLLGAQSLVNLTYFGRRSDDLIQLQRRGLTYSSYLNTGSGEVDGLELEMLLNWQKVDFNLSLTYTHSRNTQRYIHQLEGDGHTLENGEYGYALSDTPEWLGYMRLTWYPLHWLSLFGEVDYRSDTRMYPAKMLGKLTTTGLGSRILLPYGLNITAGISDVFNEGPKLREHYTYRDTTGHNPLYPIQGRTWYATLQWDF